MSRFGTGSNSNGQFWYGNTTNFPGLLYKKNVRSSWRKIHNNIYTININLDGAFIF